MNKPVAYYISELLFIHDCVIVPDFGGFVANKRSAQLNKEVGSLTPPSKQVLFNTNLKTNDGLLIAHIADQEAITQKIAQKNVQVFANESNKKLSTSKVLRIPKIGLFAVGKEGNILFLQDSAINYSLEYIGMKPTKNKSIIREKEKPAEIITQKIKSVNINSRFFMRVAAIILPLFMLSYLSITQQDRINNVYTQMATFNPFNTSVIVDKNIVSNTEKTLRNSLEAVTNKNNVIEKNTATIISQKKYYIIAGSFREQKNAKRMLAKLNKWEYNASLVKGDNLLRVSYASFNITSTSLLFSCKL